MSKQIIHFVFALIIFGVFVWQLYRFESLRVLVDILLTLGPLYVLYVISFLKVDRHSDEWKYGSIVILGIVAVVHYLKIFFGPIDCFLFDVNYFYYLFYEFLAAFFGLILLRSSWKLRLGTIIRRKEVALIFVVGAVMVINHLIKLFSGGCF